MGANNTADTVLNVLSGRAIAWALPVLVMTLAGWAFNAELRIKELEIARLEAAQQQVKIEALEKRVSDLAVIEERIQNIRDTLQEIRSDLSHGHQ